MAVSVDKPAPRSRENRGFTVIETIIVLGIGSLILTIVMLAIPALERNSRNNERRQDVQIILQAVSNYELNNSGNVPGTNQLRNFLNLYEARKITYYSTANISSNIQTASSRADQAAVTDIEAVSLYNYEKCDTVTNGAATITGAGYNDVVALFAIETGRGGVSSQCEQL